MPEPVGPVVANTTPLIALAAIGRLDLLPHLYGGITISEAVAEELAAGRPERIVVPNPSTLSWITTVPKDPPQARRLLYELDDGEASTLLLALRLKAWLVIMDEKLGHRTAEYLGLRVTGTLGVLARAKREKWGRVAPCPWSSSADGTQIRGVDTVRVVPYASHPLTLSLSPEGEGWDEGSPLQRISIPS